jgi:hypothetical protein
MHCFWLRCTLLVVILGAACSRGSSGTAFQPRPTPPGAPVEKNACHFAQRRGRVRMAEINRNAKVVQSARSVLPRRFDAHSHVHLGEGVGGLDEGLSMATMGTRPSDWDAVEELARANPDRVVPCFGLHPWCVRNPAREGPGASAVLGADAPRGFGTGTHTRWSASRRAEVGCKTFGRGLSGTLGQQWVKSGSTASGSVIAHELALRWEVGLRGCATLC